MPEIYASREAQKDGEIVALMTSKRNTRSEPQTIDYEVSARASYQFGASVPLSGRYVPSK